MFVKGWPKFIKWRLRRHRSHLYLGIIEEIEFRLKCRVEQGGDLSQDQADRILHRVALEFHDHWFEKTRNKRIEGFLEAFYERLDDKFTYLYDHEEKTDG